MFKKLAAVTSAIVFAASASSPAFAGNSSAQALYDYGLVHGTGIDQNGNPVFDIDRPLTRQEAVIMLCGMLNADVTDRTCRFSDVPKWAAPYVGYASDVGIVSGYDENTFGGSDPITSSQFISFVLRAMGYGNEFRWDRAWELSDDLGITDGLYPNEQIFTRGNAMDIFYSALFVEPKNSDKILFDTLVTIEETNKPAGQPVGHSYGRKGSSNEITAPEPKNDTQAKPPVEPPKDAPAEPPKDTKTDTPKDTPVEPPKDTKTDTSKDTPVEPPKDTPAEPPKDTAEPPKDTPAEPPKDTAGPPKDTPVEPSIDIPKDPIIRVMPETTLLPTYDEGELFWVADVSLDEDFTVENYELLVDGEIFENAEIKKSTDLPKKYNVKIPFAENVDSAKLTFSGHDDEENPVEIEFLFRLAQNTPEDDNKGDESDSNEPTIPNALGGHMLSDEELEMLCGASPSDLKESINTISDLIGYLTISGFISDVIFEEDTWNVCISGGQSLRDNSGCCANVVCYVLAEKYDELGYIHHWATGTETILNYIFTDGTYYVFDLNVALEAHESGGNAFKYMAYERLEDFQPEYFGLPGADCIISVASFDGSGHMPCLSDGETIVLPGVEEGNITVLYLKDGFNLAYDETPDYIPDWTVGESMEGNMLKP